jgi:ABC-type transport system involved in Fe-S cluster assembly fused permease/ATPase subunit
MLVPVDNIQDNHTEGVIVTIVFSVIGFIVLLFVIVTLINMMTKRRELKKSNNALYSEEIDSVIDPR